MLLKGFVRVWCMVLISIATSSFRGFGGTYIWTGALNTDWTNAGNWAPPLFSPLVPSATDDIIISPTLIYLVAPFRYPVIKSTENITCNSLTFYSLPAPSITVNGTLNVTSNIQQDHPYLNDVNTLITGTGTINCSALLIGDTTTPNIFSGSKNTTTVTCNITQLNVTNAITVSSASGSGKTNNAVFTVTNDNGASTVTTSGLSITSPGPITGTAASLTLNNISTGAIKLVLTGITPVSISNSTYGSVDFYTGSGTGSSTVEYAGASAQTAYTDNTAGLDAAPSVYQHIRFSGAGVKTINPGNLTISGDWYSTGGNIVATSPLVVFQGITQILTDAGSNSGGGVIFKNVNFQGGGTKTISGSSASIFSVSGTGLLTMASNATLAVGTNGKLILVSDATGTATVANIPTGCSITGNVNAQRYFNAGSITANTRNYRLLSSPVNATGTIANTAAVAYYTLSYLNNNPGVFIAGPGSGFTVSNATPTMYLYKESLPASSTSFNSGNFKGIADISGTSTVLVYNDAGTTANVNATLYSGNGFMLYYAGNNTANVTSTTVPNKQYRVGGNYIDPDAATATAIGTLNQGDIPVRLWATAGTTLSDAQTGYNLAGNPYASTIDWDTFSNTIPSAPIYGQNVSKSIYIFNYSNKNYGVYQAGSGSTGTNNASRYIASGQGFFVIATNPSVSSLTFREAAKTNTQPGTLGASYLLMGLPAQYAQTPQSLRLKLAKDSVNTDEAVILFEPDGQDGYEQNIDAARLNGIGNVATLATYATGSNKQLAINHLHSIDSATRVKLFVNIAAPTGSNKLYVSGFSTLDPRYNVFLLDHFKKDSVLISQTGEYNFNISTDSAGSFGDSRFELAFHKKDNLDYRLISLSGASKPAGIQINWTTANEQNFTGFILEKADATGAYNVLANMQGNGSGAYTYVDKTPLKGVNVYRLKQSDAFDKVTYSTLNVDYSISAGDDQTIVAYPNPAIVQFSVKLNIPDIPAQVAFKMYRLSGQMLLNKIMPGNNIQQSVGGLMPGTYIIEVDDNLTKRLIGRVKISKP